MTSYDNLPYVEAALNYLAPMAEQPRYYAYDPEPGVPRSNMAHETHRVRIHDMRLRLSAGGRPAGQRR